MVVSWNKIYGSCHFQVQIFDCHEIVKENIFQSITNVNNFKILIKTSSQFLTRNSNFDPWCFSNFLEVLRTSFRSKSQWFWCRLQSLSNVFIFSQKLDLKTLQFWYKIFQATKNWRPYVSTCWFSFLKKCPSNPNRADPSRKKSRYYKSKRFNNNIATLLSR